MTSGTSGAAETPGTPNVRTTPGNGEGRGGSRTGSFLRTGSFVRTALTLLAALCAVAALPGAATAQDGSPDPYAFDKDAISAQGAAGKGAAQKLDVGAVYKSVIGPQGASTGKLYYRFDLDARADVYVSVTAVPRLGTKVDYADGLRVSIQDAQDYNCSDTNAQFGPAQSPRPVAALATRIIDPKGTTCQEAGSYYLVVERTSAASSTPDDWGLEIDSAAEPHVKGGGPTTPPGDWDSTTPQPPSAHHGERHGGTSFSTARDLEDGIWQDGITPGETLFYRVPVDWGQQVSTRADLSGAGDSASRSPDDQGGGDTQEADGADDGGGGGAPGAGGSGFVGSALSMALYNPARGFVDFTDTPYDGDQTTAEFHPLPPVAYRNRYSIDPRVAGMRFAGWYYLSVSLNPQVAKAFGDGTYQVTLSVTVSGAAQQGPAYVGASTPAGIFGVAGQDQQAAASGATSGGMPADGVLRVLGVSALGVGVGLLLVLALWSAVARRRVRAADGAGVPGAGGGYGGYRGASGYGGAGSGAGAAPDDRPGQSGWGYVPRA